MVVGHDEKFLVILTHNDSRTAAGYLIGLGSPPEKPAVSVIITLVYRRTGDCHHCGHGLFHNIGHIRHCLSVIPLALLVSAVTLGAALAVILSAALTFCLGL